jgi:hypothetical protein
MLSAGTAIAGISPLKICNNYPHKINIAIAHQDSDQSWVSTGWWILPPGDCGVLDIKLSWGKFYWRGESSEYTDPSDGTTRQMIWGEHSDTKFSVMYSGGAFLVHNADTPSSGATLVGFNKADLNIHVMEADTPDLPVTLTFKENGSPSLFIEQYGFKVEVPGAIEDR